MNSTCQCDAVSCPMGCCDGASLCRTPVSVGACGTAGGQCVDCGLRILHAAAICGATGVCDYTACSGGYADVDGNRSNGCESTLPTGVPESASLVLWLAGEDYNGQVWPDRSLGRRDANAYGGSPAIAQRNGRNVVNFNGGGQLLVSAGFPNWAGLTLFAVSSTSNGDFFISMGVSYNPGCSTTPPAGAPGCVAYDQLGFPPEMSLQQCDPAAGTCYQAYGPAPLAGWFRSTAWENPQVNPSFRSFFNGVDNGNLNHNLNYPYPPPWPTPRKDTVLGWRNYRGLVAEIILYNAPLSDASRVAVDTYLGTKWKVP
jgi:hypothetical protein